MSEISCLGYGGRIQSDRPYLVTVIREVLEIA